MSWTLSNTGLLENETTVVTTNVPIPGNPIQNHTVTVNSDIINATATLGSPNPYSVIARNIFRRPSGTVNTSPSPGVTNALPGGGFFAMNTLAYSPFSSTTVTDASTLSEGMAGFWMESPIASIAAPGIPTQFLQFGIVNAPQFGGGMRSYGPVSIFGVVPTTPGWANQPALSISSTAPASPGAAIGVFGGAPGAVTYYMRFASGSSPAVERGSIYSPGSTTVYATSSDYRLKNNIAPLDPESELEKINELKPRSWKWKESNDPATGFIAHEIQEVYENAGVEGLVSGEKDQVVEYGYFRYIETQEPVENIDFYDETLKELTKKPRIVQKPTEEEISQSLSEGKEWFKTEEQPLYQTVDTSFLISPLVSSVQALSNKVKLLEERVAALESA